MRILQDLHKYKQNLYESRKDIDAIRLVNPDYKSSALLYGVEVDGGYVFLFTMLSNVNKNYNLVKDQLIYITIVVIILAVVLSFILSKIFSEPIVNITEKAKMLANGNFNVEFEKDGVKEIDELADTLNYLKDYCEIDLYLLDPIGSLMDSIPNSVKVHKMKKNIFQYILFRFVKFYRKYVPEANVSRRICHYCKQDIQPGQLVVTKCKHIMHVFCWQQNGYKCAEYGQNCKTGIQSHIEWKGLFTLNSLKECSQAISGIIAGFVSWILFELAGVDLFQGLSETIVRIFYSSETETLTLYSDCVNKISAFLTIGLLLGFFVSLIFRYNDEYKKKDIKVWGKIFGLSLLSGLIGMMAFASGGVIMCHILSSAGTTIIPWYCSFPAYLLFSISVSLFLTVQSTIPVKSALLGGLSSSIIGFIVLYCSSSSNNMSGWMNMLLDFIIYGGGLGASLVTVRMLAEKYYLVIQNGVRAGQRIPVHKWMNATGGGNKVTIGMTGECEIQMNWEKSNKVAKEHLQLFIDYDKQLPMLNPLASGVIYNTRAELPVRKPTVLSNGDSFKIGDTIFLYQETE